jgi:hypothetical protein
MARHLIYGDCQAGDHYTSTAGNIYIEKRSASGSTALAANDTIVEAPEIRFAMYSAANGKIVTPWIWGRNVINYTGQSAVLQVAGVATADFATGGANLTVAADITLKLVNVTNGEPEFKSYTLSGAAGLTPTLQATGLFNMISVDLPHWISTVADNGAGLLTFTGHGKGAVKADGSVAEELSNWTAASEGLDGSNGGLVTCAYTTQPYAGYGSGFHIRQFEEDIRGTTYGDYSRAGTLPKTPAAEISTGATAITAEDGWDTIVIVATKDGSTSSGINGVDNLIEIVVAEREIVAGTPNGTAMGCLATILNCYFGDGTCNACSGATSLNFACLTI